MIIDTLYYNCSPIKFMLFPNPMDGLSKTDNTNPYALT